jgi:hypothetical protein
MSNQIKKSIKTAWTIWIIDDKGLSSACKSFAWYEYPYTPKCGDIIETPDGQKIKVDYINHVDFDVKGKLINA